MSYFSNFSQYAPTLPNLSQYAPTLPNLSQYAPTLPNLSSATAGFSNHWNALKGRISVAGQEAKGYCDRTSSSIIDNVRGVWEKFLSYFSVSDATSSLSANWSSLRGRVSVAGQSAQEYCVSIGASVSGKVQTIRENLVSYLPVSGAHARELEAQLFQSQGRVVTLQAELSTSEGYVTSRGEHNAGLLAQLRVAREKVNKFEVIGPKLQSKIVECDFRIDTLQRANAQLSEDLRAARADLEEVRRANASLDRQPRGGFDEGVVLSPVKESDGVSGDEPVHGKTVRRSNSFVAGLKGTANLLGFRNPSSTPRGGAGSHRPSFNSDSLDLELLARGTSQEPGANRGSFLPLRPGSAPLPSLPNVGQRSKSPSTSRSQVAPAPSGKEGSTDC